MVPDAEPKYFDHAPDDPNDDLQMRPSRKTMVAPERRGGRLLKAPAAALVIGLALPLLLIYWIKAPLPDQHLFFLGISFTKLVLLLWISAAIVAYLAVFALTMKPYYVLGVFLTALFGCFPLVVGLKNDLTLAQTLSNAFFFPGWPFFLKPGYVLLQILLPAGMITYLSLQVKDMFSKQGYATTYFLAAIYLGLATFIGLDTLNQTGQPNLISLFSRAGQSEPPVVENQPPPVGAPPAPVVAIHPLDPPIFSPQVESTPLAAPITAAPAVTPAPARIDRSIPLEPSDIERWRQLEAKLDRILQRLEMPSPPQPLPSPLTENTEHRLADQVTALNSKIDQILSRLTAEQIPAAKSADAPAAQITPAAKPVGPADQTQTLPDATPSSIAPKPIDTPPGPDKLNGSPVTARAATVNTDDIAADRKPDIAPPPDGPAKDQLSDEFAHLVDKIDRIWQLVTSIDSSQTPPPATETRVNDVHAGANEQSKQEP